MRRIHAALAAIFCLGAVLHASTLPFTHPTQDEMLATLQKVDRVLTPPFRINFNTSVAALLPKSIFEAGFNANASLLETEIKQQFALLDSDGDGQLTRGDLVAYHKGRNGWLSYTAKRLFSDLGRIINEDLIAWDTDRNGNVTIEEFNATVFDVMQQPLQLSPIDYRPVCSSFKLVTEHCTMGTALQSAYNWQLQRCETGYSLVAQQFAIETCVLSQLAATQTGCAQVIAECMSGKYVDKAAEKKHAQRSKNELLANTTATVAVEGASIDPFQLEMSFLPPQNNQTMAITLMQALFQNNVTTMDSAVLAAFTKADVNGNQALTMEDIEAALKDRVGRFAFAAGNVFGKVHDQIKAAFAAMDTNGDGNVTFVEFNKTLTETLSMPFPVPQNYTLMCDAMVNQVTKCSDTLSTHLQQLLATQTVMCRSGYSWLATQFALEKCLIRTNPADTHCLGDIDTCFTALPPMTAAEKINATLNGNAVSLKKRGILQTLPLLNIVTSGVFGVILAILSSVVIALGAAWSYEHQMTKYWHRNTQFERWMVGAPLPPCGTPVVYWAPQCGPLFSTASRTCPRGQLFHKKGCQWWWIHGSRSCNVLGCQTMCMDVITDTCKGGEQPKFRLDYDEYGAGRIQPM